MLLKERRNFQIINRMKDLLMDSRNDIGTSINSSELFITPLKTEGFEKEELLYSIRYMIRKNYLEPYDGNPNNTETISLTIKGYDEWLFPRGILDPTKIFISHASEDKKLAGRLKKELAESGFSIFIAHDDIPGTVEFRDRLLSELETCSVFIALRTKDYDKKSYTEQECGFALALGKRILPLFVDTKPKNAGFCAAIQGKSFTEDEITEIIKYCRKQLGTVTQ